jgi:hypothetical protein
MYAYIFQCMIGTENFLFADEGFGPAESVS